MKLRPPTPGAVVRAYLEQHDITQERAAKAIGMNRVNFNRFLGGHSGCNVVLALKLARAFSTTPEFWLNLQRAVDLFDHRVGERAQVSSRIAVLRKAGTMIETEPRRKS